MRKRLVAAFLAGLAGGAALVMGLVILLSGGSLASGKVLVPVTFGALIYLGYLGGLLRAEVGR
ncbi:hypothetical protein LJC64_02395 [Ruminococcaceae bacterium OttesenSCG-928-A11]|nr:hypothetical protein [Ruminococcaceae bacterium OttesenSCG-928-A11]